ncbi:hypothetical protein SLS58_003885 [Diplodia intermedia]|uniref:BHLH domain-containing protein n=1 Tax=Diplodia intermedia TaxID=856260 RepID=A0ABR3TV05_9PEZI
MSQSAPQHQWSQPLDNMAMQQDFENLLDFGDIDLDIPFYDSGETQPSDHQLSALADSLDSQHLPPSGAIQPQNQDDGSGAQQQQSLQSPSTMHDTSGLFDFSFESAYNHTHQQSQQQQTFSAPHDHSMQPRAFVPPTPNSVEMHGDATRYMNHLDPQTRAILEQRYQLRKEDLATVEGQQMCPATPASLMRLQPSPKNNSQSNSQSGTPSFIPQGSTQLINDDFTLPEPAASTAATSRPSVSRVDTAIHDDQSTPRMPARKTPKLGPLSTPSGSILPSAAVSPSIGGMASPSSTTGTKKSELKPAGRGGKKRGSVGSALVSPALRPKISPSIKPLLPEGATTSDDTHALLLASKSNYQHILEGTHVPGVTYPEALSTNLTSKRTSHKIAEQGRRNRINIALQELQSLIPSPTINPKDAGASATIGNSASPEESALKKEERQSNSKASTVENAIEYIRLLQRKDEERDRKMVDQRKEIEELRKRLKSGKIESEKTGTIQSGTEAVQETKGFGG